MRIIKHRRLGLLKRALPWGGRTLMSFGLVTAFPFAKPRRLLQEGDMWEAITPILGDRTLDTGEPKARAEVVVYGSYHAPGGRPVLQHGARLVVGPIDKAIRVTGRREWRRTPENEPFATQPEPFTTMPLDDWRLAFGGPQFPDNPTGMGYWREDIFTADGRYPLPCVEYQRTPLINPAQVPAPACLGPRDLMLPARQKHAGTYDRFWAENHAPGLAADATLDLFQVAAPDQQIDGFFEGREAILVGNMHPGLPLQTSRLPGVRPRLFIRRHQHHQWALEELALHAETLVLFPEISVGVLIHRTNLWVSAFDHPEIDLLLAGFEWQEQRPRPLDYYAADLARRLDPEDGFKLGLDHSSLSPAGWKEPPAEKASWFKVMKPGDPALPPRLQAQVDEATARMEAAIPPDVLAGMKARAAAYQAPAAVKALRAELDAIKAITPAAHDPRVLKPQLDRIADKARRMLDQASDQARNRARAVATTAGMDYDALVARGAAEAAKTPQEMLARADAAIAHTASVAPPAMRQQILDAMPGKQLGHIDQAMADISALQTLMRAQVGHMMPPAPTPAPAEAARRLAGLQAALRNGTALDTSELAGLDLSGLNFQGRDLTEADFTGCRLVGARFDNAVLARACFAGAVLDDASLTGADLTDANLGRASLNRTRFAGSRLERTQLGQVHGQQTDFSGTVLAELVVANAALTGARFVEAQMTDVTLTDATLDDAVFDRADMQKVTLIGCRADRARFDGVAMTRCTMVNCRMHDADFSHARIERLSTAGKTDLARSRFDRARMPAVCLIGASLPNTSWVAANVSSALFIQADLRQAHFASALAANASFMRAHLSHADLRGSDLAGASLIKADFRYATLAGTSLYGADLTDAILDHAVLDGALVDLTRLAGPNFPAAE